MSEYRVSFSGFAIVEADSAEEAEKAFFDDAEIYSEYGVDEVEEA